MTEVRLLYEPREIFVPFHMRKQRWAVIVAHRRAGKTVAVLMDMIDHALRAPLPNSRYAFIAPYYVQAKTVAWDYLKMFARPVLAGPPNESELRVDLVNGSRISLFGGDNGDRLRGLALDGVALDEFADQPPSLWGSVIRPALADRRGWATIIGTIKGRNQLWKLYDEAEPSEWYRSILKASETRVLDEAELLDLRQTLTPEAYAAEIECDPNAAIVGAYYGKDIAELERKGRITGIEPIDGPVHTAWDLGIGDSTAIWFWQAADNEIRVIDFYENHGQAIPHYVAEIEARCYPKGVDYVPHDARVRSLETGRTRIETLISLGRKPMLVANHKIMDGINAVRLTMPRIWFDAGKCKDGIEALRQYRADFDEKTRAFKDTPRHDFTSHCADAFRYLCMAWREQVKPEEKPELPDVKAIGDYTVEEMWKFARRPRERV
jgi:hypothetical protein